MMPWLATLFLFGLLIGISILIVKADKGTIRREVKSTKLELVKIETSFDFLLRHFKYVVTYRTPDGLVEQANCRVSFFLGVVWEKDDSFLKWLIP